ncbi:hypothetical protein VNO77_22776 [Canavalia gladiata]|uniref:Uncharacterized protein n=1 Tax=Canavalia gladiata TaxID=3824 RepID=A0AAN9L3E3_CANGL
MGKARRTIKKPWTNTPSQSFHLYLFWDSWTLLIFYGPSIQPSGISDLGEAFECSISSIPIHSFLIGKALCPALLRRSLDVRIKFKILGAHAPFQYQTEVYNGSNSIFANKAQFVALLTSILSTLCGSDTSITNTRSCSMKPICFPLWEDCESACSYCDTVFSSLSSLGLQNVTALKPLLVTMARHGSDRKPTLMICMCITLTLNLAWYFVTDTAGVYVFFGALVVDVVMPKEVSFI